MVAEKTRTEQLLDSKSDFELSYFSICGRFMEDEPEDAPKPGEPSFREEVLARTERDLQQLIEDWQAEQDAA